MQRSRTMMVKRCLPLGAILLLLLPILAASGAPGQVPTSVPLYGLFYALFYNKAMFRQAGIQSPPSTWSEFIKDAQLLTKPKIGQWGVAVEGASISENAHWAFLLSQQQ